MVSPLRLRAADHSELPHLLGAVLGVRVAHLHLAARVGEVGHALAVPLNIPQIVPRLRAHAVQLIVSHRGQPAALSPGPMRAAHADVFGVIAVALSPLEVHAFVQARLGPEARHLIQPNRSAGRSETFSQDFLSKDS